MAQYPGDLLYTKDHEWARVDGDRARIGVTAYAVEQLGDITLVELPPVGEDVQAQERCGDIESVKTVSELFAPVSGEVLEVNQDLEDSPELINEAPYQTGWLMVVRVSDPDELSSLMDAAAYEEYLGTLE
ncbi:MAG: glycine cleavage system protein GcvH [Myxococcales bacterium]|nr:glycine cleavage system protein GcvH [Myxococcales bacterium]